MDELRTEFFESEPDFMNPETSRPMGYNKVAPFQRSLFHLKWLKMPKIDRNCMKKGQTG